MRRPWSRSPTVLIPAAVIFLGGVALLFVFVERWTAEEPNWSLIEEGLYQGGLVSKPPPGTQAVLNLCESEDSYQCEIHRWQAIRDASPAPSLEWLQQQVAFVDGQRQAGRSEQALGRRGLENPADALLRLDDGDRRVPVGAHQRSERRREQCGGLLAAVGGALHELVAR